MEATTIPKVPLFLILLLVATSTSARAQTQLGFYLFTCPRAESIVRSAVQAHFQSNPTVAPGLLRMFFHDCFIRGCDASILIDGPSTEKSAGPNSLLRGFDVIDDAKSQLEAACPGVVSCADILALAARDSVVLSGGVSWPVLTGRKDGRVSVGSDTNNLPNFRDPVNVQIQKFADKGLNTQDLVTLVGGHTIGTAACALFSYRLYNYNSTNGPDPSINPQFLPQLQALCPQNGDGSVRVGLDTGSVNSFDNSFFSNLRNGQGVLESDQRLWADPTTQGIVQRFLGFRGLLGLRFDVEFGKSMVKMGNVGVKTGSDGEIRKVCTAIN